MTVEELKSVIKLIDDCQRYLDGQTHSKWIEEIAQSAAKRAVVERQRSLYERLQMSGLRIDIEVL